MSHFLARHDILNELALGIPYNSIRKILPQEFCELSKNQIKRTHPPDLE